MTPEEILDAIGDVDEAYIQKAKKRKPYQLFAAAAAACLALAVLLPAMGGGFSAKNESSDIKIKVDQENYQEIQDIAQESGTPDDRPHEEDWCQAEIREQGGETVTAFNKTTSATIRRILESLTAEDSIGAYSEPEERGWLIRIKDAQGAVTEYVLQDNVLYDCTNRGCYTPEETALLKLREAMGLD